VTVKERKKILRREYRRRLLKIPAGEIRKKSSFVTMKALNLPVLATARIVGAYASITGEVATGDLLSELLSEGKRLVLPVIKKTAATMEFREVKKLKGMVTGVYGILEPREGDLYSPHCIDLLFVPGVAFDRRGGRLGRGKGYYDRYLKALRPGVLKVGLAFSEQLATEVPRNKEDVNMDLLVTEEEVIICTEKIPAADMELPEAPRQEEKSADH